MAAPEEELAIAEFNGIKLSRLRPSRLENSPSCEPPR
jgi:hypothetical protein